MFKVQPVFVNNQAKKQFLEFFLSRVNRFAEAHSSEWQPDMAWSLEDIDKLLVEFSFKNVVYPFTNRQLIQVATWVKEKYGIFKRFSVEEMAVVLSHTFSEKADNPKAESLTHYVSLMMDTLQRWDECPMGFNMVSKEELVPFILAKIAENPPAVQDPPIIEETIDDIIEKGDSEDEAGAGNKDDEDEAVEGDVVEDAKVEDEAVIEESTEEIEEPVKSRDHKKESSKKESSKKVPPKASAKKSSPKTSQPFHPPKGPKLVQFIKSLLEDYLQLENPKDHHRQEMVRFARSLEKEANAEKYYTAIIQKAIKLTEPEDEYNVAAMVEDIMENM